MPTRAWVVLGPEWKATVAALRTADERLPSWLRDEMREAVNPLVSEARSRVLALDVLGGPTRSTGLRARVAKGVGVRAGVGKNPYLRVYTSMPKNDQAPIPRGLDQAAGWRHPLFGDKRFWYQSRPARTGWFTDTLADGRDEVQRALESALERAAKMIASAS